MRKGLEWQILLKMSDVKTVKKAGTDYFLDTGSPHLVRFIQSLDNYDVLNNGRKIRYSEDFKPGGTNVDFIEWTKGGLFVRTYERGVEEETLSCGTGVTASALAYAAKNNLSFGEIPLRTKGGSLKVSFLRNPDRFSDIWLEGPARLVFNGRYNPALN